MVAIGSVPARWGPVRREACPLAQSNSSGHAFSGSSVCPQRYTRTGSVGVVQTAHPLRCNGSHLVVGQGSGLRHGPARTMLLWLCHDRIESGILRRQGGGLILLGQELWA